MSTIWEEFGFKESPYRNTPLEATADDFRLFAPRAGSDEEQFLAAMDRKNRAVVIVSGNIGIGKTSFVNAQQHILSTEPPDGMPKLIPSVSSSCPDKRDSRESLARRFVFDAMVNIERYCKQRRMRIPKNCSELRKAFFSTVPEESSFQYSVAGTGWGRSITPPRITDITLEMWRDILEKLASSAKTECKVDGIVVCVENAETIELDVLADFLMSYRDTLFAIDGIWWVIIGQSRLYQELDRFNRKISQRIDAAVELAHFTSEEFHDLIKRRIQVYRNKADAISPLPPQVHDILFRAARGEIRFVLDTANKLFDAVISRVRDDVRPKLTGRAAPDVMASILKHAIQSHLIDKQIPEKFALSTLREQVKAQLDDNALLDTLLRSLPAEKEDAIRSSMFKRYGYGDATEFTAEMLEQLLKEGLLARSGVGKSATYGLKGFAWIVRELERRERLAPLEAGGHS